MFKLHSQTRMLTGAEGLNRWSMSINRAANRSSMMRCSVLKLQGIIFVLLSLVLQRFASA